MKNQNYKELYNLLMNQVFQAHKALIDAQTGVLETASAMSIAEKLLRTSIELHGKTFNNKIDTRIKNLYTYLDEMGFEEQIKDKGKLYRKVKDPATNELFTDSNLQQSYFSILHQLYLTIYYDIHNIENHLGD